MIAYLTTRGTPEHEAMLDAYLESGLVCETYLRGVYDHPPELRGVEWFRVYDLAPDPQTGTFLWHLSRIKHVGEA